MLPLEKKRICLFVLFIFIRSEIINLTINESSCYREGFY